MRHTEWQEDDVAGRGVDAPIVDHEAGRALEHDELLILATVHMQWRGRPARRVPLPHPGVPLRLLGGQLDRDPAAGDPPASALPSPAARCKALLDSINRSSHSGDTSACVLLLRHGAVKHPVFARSNNGPDRRPASPFADDDADVWDSSAHFVDFTLRVLDKLDVIEPYDGPGDYHPSRDQQR